jgi:3-phenylpropionate/cinnamic acid dioxygenase small subunit
MSTSKETAVHAEFDAMAKRAEQFLARETMLLDNRRFWDWFALLDDQVIYQVLIRTVRGSGTDEFAGTGFRQRDDKSMIETRIKRLDTGFAWAEEPPSHTVRLLGSIVVDPTDDPNVLAVDSAVHVYRHRSQDEHGDLIAARRRDRIRFTDQGPRLLSRTVLLGDAVLTTPNLGIFL